MKKNIITVCADGKVLISMEKDAVVDKRLPGYFQEIVKNCREA